MYEYYLKRIGQAIITVFTVITASFFLVRLLPGGPMDYLRAQYRQQGLDASQINSLIQTYTNVQPDRPLWEQYLSYVVSILQGDFGRSVWYDQPVASLLGEALPWTLFVMSTAILLSFLLGILGGAAMAYREGSFFDSTGSVVATFFSSVPYYLVGILMLSFLGFRMGYFPTGGLYGSGYEAGLNIPFLTSALHHAALPILSIVVTSFGTWALNMRGNSIQVLGSDYLRVARLAGLSERTIVTRYVTRNAILPMYTGLLIAIGFQFGSSIILERIFSYQGLGYYLFKSIGARDYPLMMGGFILITVSVTVGILFADFTYSKIDPRVSNKGGANETY